METYKFTEHNNTETAIHRGHLITSLINRNNVCLNHDDYAGHIKMSKHTKKISLLVFIDIYGSPKHNYRSITASCF